MKYIKLTCVFLFIIQISNTFSQSNADYFPWKTGDMWEYTLYYWPDIDTLQTIVIDDSTDEEGNIYTSYFSRAINPIEPPSALLLDTVVYKIDTNLYVYGPGFEKWGNIYRLNGNAGDQWVFWDYSHGGGGPYEMARIDSVSEIIIFGDTTKIMFMRYYSANDSTDTLGIFARYYDQLLKGFGFYFRGGVELDAQIYLHGCVIDGVLYGDTTQVVTSVNELQGYGYFTDDFVLFPNYPNPFNSSTKIPLKLSNEGIVSLAIYDVLGKEIMKLVDKQFYPTGYYEFNWEANNAVSGVYYYVVSINKNRKIRSMVLLK